MLAESGVGPDSTVARFCMHPKRWFLIVLAVLGFFAAQPAVADDMIYFSDGRVLLGEIIKENDDEIEAKGKINGVDIHSTFKRAMIASVIKNVSTSTPSKVDSNSKDEDAKGS